MQRETALQVAIDMWGCIIDGYNTVFPFKTAHSFLNGAYVCVEAPDLPLGRLIELHCSEINKHDEFLNVSELLSIINTIAKAQVMSEFNVSIYQDAKFQIVPLPTNIIFVEVGLPRPSIGQVKWYKQVCGEGEMNFRIIANNWAAAYASFCNNEEELQSIISQIRFSLQLTEDDSIDRFKALLGAYFLDLRISGFDIPTALPPLISSHMKIWFDVDNADTLSSSNIFLGLFPTSRSNQTYDLMDPIIARLFSKLQIPRSSVDKNLGEAPAISGLDKTKKNKINHEAMLMLLRLLRWVPADLTTLPYSPDVGEVQNFIDGHIIGPKKSNFKLEWDQRPGSGWNYAATQAFTQLFMDESESYDRMLFAHSDLQRQFARRFSYLRIKRKEKLIVQDGTDVEQKKLKEKSLSQLKQRRRANRRKGLFKNRLGIASATPEWPPTVSQVIALLGSDGTSSDETDSDDPNRTGGGIKYRRVPKLFRSPFIDELIEAVDARGTELFKGRRTGQPFRRRIGNHSTKINAVIIDGLPENFYNKTWLSTHRPDAMSLLQTGPDRPIPRLSVIGER